MSEPVKPLALEQINIVVRDMQRSLAFDRLLGVSIEDTQGPEWAEWAPHQRTAWRRTACASSSTASRSRSMEPKPR